MRLLTLFVFFFSALLPCVGQTPISSPVPGLPSDPRKIFKAADPYYDFNTTTQKPWHLKATYQLYDEAGKPTEQGSYEYWWSSPLVCRSTWTRAESIHSDWDTSDGKFAHLTKGKSFNFFEYKLKSAIFSPLPSFEELDKSYVEKQKINLGGNDVQCIMVTPKMVSNFPGKAPLGVFPTYCFDGKQPVLLGNYSFGALFTQFSRFSKFQNHYLPHKIDFSEGKRKILTATVDVIEGISAIDPALTPSADAVIYSKTHTETEKNTTPQGGETKKVQLPAESAAGMLLKKVAPYYPQDAKNARISGTVTLQALIGRDGNIHDLHVIYAPAATLAEAALWAVSQWHYKPYLLKGEPVEVETTVKVIFQFG